jgi:hypothetical protein
MRAAKVETQEAEHPTITVLAQFVLRAFLLNAHIAAEDVLAPITPA